MSRSTRVNGVLRRAYLRGRLRHRAWRYRLRTEQPELRFMLAHLARGQTAIDAGAHKGAYLYWMLRCVGRTGRVVGFEPLPHLARYLDQLVDAFGVDNVAIVRSALSDADGTLPLYVPKSGYLGTTTFMERGDDHDKIDVPLTRLDDWCAEHETGPVHFIKCDVEGHEYELFRGAENTLRAYRPTLLFECTDVCHPDGQIERVHGFLRQFGYRGVFFSEGRELPLEEFEVAVHQRGIEDPKWAPNFGFFAG